MNRQLCLPWNMYISDLKYWRPSTIRWHWWSNIKWYSEYDWWISIGWTWRYIFLIDSGGGFIGSQGHVIVIGWDIIVPRYWNCMITVWTRYYETIPSRQLAPFYLRSQLHQTGQQLSQTEPDNLGSSLQSISWSWVMSNLPIMDVLGPVII